MRVLVRFLAFFATILFVALGHAADWAPPPLDPQYGHVKDEAGVLTQEQIARLDAKLDRTRREKGFAIVVYMMTALPEGVSIEDVGYKAGNAWKVGSAKGDDGIILIATITDRHLRIETGKGAGGALTDIGASRINREVIGPLMKQGLYYEAMNRGTDAIIKELGGEVSAAGREAQKRAPPKAEPQDWLRTGIGAVIIVLVIIGAIVSPTFRQILFFMLLFGRGGGGRGGGGGGGGGSGYGGGGGSFGGGGSSDDY